MKTRTFHVWEWLFYFCFSIEIVGTQYRNGLLYNPFGNLLVLYGHGNIRGAYEVWDLVAMKKVSSQDAEYPTYVEWSPDGKVLLMATTSPRLKVLFLLIVSPHIPSTSSPHSPHSPLFLHTSSPYSPHILHTSSPYSLHTFSTHSLHILHTFSAFSPLFLQICFRWRGFRWEISTFSGTTPAS